MMNYKEIVEEQIKKLCERQKKIENKPIAIEEYVRVAKAISELAVIASKM